MDTVGKNVMFFLKNPDLLKFLWVVIHFIAVVYYILNVRTNYFREDW